MGMHPTHTSQSPRAAIQSNPVPGTAETNPRKMDEELRGSAYGRLRRTTRRAEKSLYGALRTVGTLLTPILTVAPVGRNCPTLLTTHPHSVPAPLTFLPTLTQQESGTKMNPMFALGTTATARPSPRSSIARYPESTYQTPRWTKTFLLPEVAINVVRSSTQKRATTIRLAPRAKQPPENNPRTPYTTK